LRLYKGGTVILKIGNAADQVRRGWVGEHRASDDFRTRPGFLCPQILADPMGQTDGATRVHVCYERTGGANHQQN
jgi:hypothetical protein